MERVRQFLDWVHKAPRMVTYLMWAVVIAVVFYVLITLIVFICCEGCRERLLADPDRYLAKLPKEAAR